MNDRVRFGGERALVLMRLRAWKNRIRDVCGAGCLAGIINKYEKIRHLNAYRWILIH
jgi:hypothetical protein